MKIEQQTAKWQVPLENINYPKEIEATWERYKEADDTLDVMHVWPDSESGPNRDELKWAIEELAYDAANANKCSEDMAHALRAAENPQARDSSRSAVQPFGSAREPMERATGDLSLDAQEHLGTGVDVTNETSEVSQTFKSPSAEHSSADDPTPTARLYIFSC